MMLHHCQARSVDDIYLEDIIHIIHPETAARYLADTALPNRNIPMWDLPQGYNALVKGFEGHFLHRAGRTQRERRCAVLMSGSRKVLQGMPSITTVFIIPGTMRGN